MYIRMTEDLVNIHRHVKTENGMVLSENGMNKVREAVKVADDKDLAPGNTVCGLVIASCVNKHTAGKMETVVTLKAPTSVEDWEDLK